MEKHLGRRWRGGGGGFGGGGVSVFIFDLDDTLIHSTIDFIKMKEATLGIISSYGAPLNSLSLSMKTYELIQSAISLLERMGADASEISRMMEEAKGVWDRIELEGVQDARPVDGAKEVLREIRDRGCRIGVVTRSCRRYALKALDVTGLRGLIDVVVARGDCEKQKPNPEPLIKGIRLLGSREEAAVMIGDSVTDLECSRKANVRFIGVRYPWSHSKALDRLGDFETVSSLGRLVDLFFQGITFI